MLVDFCIKNRIAISMRVDIWDMTLEPFLNPEFTKKIKETFYNALCNRRISRKLCDELRQEVSGRMIAYNFESCLWDWCHLGLYDILCASCGILSGKKHCLPDDEFKLFYNKAMLAALKGFDDSIQQEAN